MIDFKVRRQSKWIIVSHKAFPFQRGGLLAGVLLAVTLWPVVVLLAAGGGVFWHIRRKRRAKQAQPPADAAKPDDSAGPEQ